MTAIYSCRMAKATLHASPATKARLIRLAAERHESIDQTVTQAILALRQSDIGRDLTVELRADETLWLDADGE